MIFQGLWVDWGGKKRGGGGRLLWERSHREVVSIESLQNVVHLKKVADHAALPVRMALFLCVFQRNSPITNRVWTVSLIKKSTVTV